MDFEPKRNDDSFIHLYLLVLFFPVNHCHLDSIILSILSSMPYIFFHTALFGCKIVLGVKLIPYLAGHFSVRIQSLYVITWHNSLAMQILILLYFLFCLFSKIQLVSKRENSGCFPTIALLIVFVV